MTHLVLLLDMRLPFEAFAFLAAFGLQQASFAWEQNNLIAGLYFDVWVPKIASRPLKCFHKAIETWDDSFLSLADMTGFHTKSLDQILCRPFLH